MPGGPVSAVNNFGGLAARRASGCKKRCQKSPMSHKEQETSTLQRVLQTRGARNRGAPDSAALTVGDWWATAVNGVNNGQKRSENLAKRV